MTLEGIDARDLAEKLSPPRALERIGCALYGPPLAGSRRAWLAWLSAPLAARAAALGRATLHATIERARADGAATLTAGGPPGNYLLSGVDARDRDVIGWLGRYGFTERGRHADLVVETRGARACADVERCPEASAREVFAWISRNFSSAWAMEAARAHAHDGLFIARAESGLAGFAAHSGNLVSRGTFGPVGVLPEARGSGAGRRLTETVLSDLAALGHDTAVVPWVDLATVAFYERFCDVVARTERVVMTLDLPTG